jgi:hypothetical protein
MEILNEKKGTASEEQINESVLPTCSLEGTTWNYEMQSHNGNKGSGQFIFKSGGKCIIQQLKPSPTWWTVSYQETGANTFTMREQGSGSAYGSYQGSYHGTRGGGIYTVHPSNPANNAVFTITEA